MRVDGEWRRILNKVRTLAAALLITLFAALLSAETAPVTADGKLTIVVDPGHGGADGGAVSADGIQEAGLNLTVAKMLKAQLEELGMEVIMTRQDENALASTKKADMAARRSIMNQNGVDGVVSIHMNKFTDCSVHGPMTFYMEGREEGAKLAKAVIDS
ncbi:MAG: N-acetylmuramoyl-L-alanine amidase, partial [Clostridia bacterium]|nr:N-acetylmuramoyl-L-alanine amidase [Clostridia bacterium]